MKNQTLNIQQMQHLKELGVDTSKASAYWHRVIRMNTNEVVTNWFVSFTEPSQCLATMRVETIPTFTLQDILDLLPICINKAGVVYELRIKRMVFDDKGVMYAVLYEEQDYIDWYVMQSYPNLLDSLYEMLLWCIEQGHVETKKKE